MAKKKKKGGKGAAGKKKIKPTTTTTTTTLPTDDPVVSDEQEDDRIVVVVSRAKSIAELRRRALDLRNRHIELEFEIEERTETMAANVEDRDRVISTKAQIINDLIAQRAKMEDFVLTMRRKYADALAVDEADSEVRVAQLGVQGRELEARIAANSDSNAAERQAALSEEVAASREAFESSLEEQRVRLEAVQTKLKNEELRWLSELASTDEPSQAEQQAMMDRVSHTYETMKTEHSEMGRLMRKQANQIGTLLEVNRRLAEEKTLKQLEYTSLTEMNEISFTKLSKKKVPIEEEEDDDTEASSMSLAAPAAAPALTDSTSTLGTVTSLMTAGSVSDRPRRPKPPKASSRGPSPQVVKRMLVAEQRPPPEQPPPPSFEELDQMMKLHLNFRASIAKSVATALEKRHRKHLEQETDQDERRFGDHFAEGGLLDGRKQSITVASLQKLGLIPADYYTGGHEY